MRYQEQIKRIQYKVRKLGVKLNKVLSLEYIQRIECEKEILFPESYTLFLTYIGNGGEGPYHGIYTLEESLQSVEDNVADIASSNSCVTDEVISDEEIINLSEEELQEKIGESLGEILEGSMDICEYGDGDFFRLIVTGANVGSIWNYSIFDPGLYNLECDILTFYENWLNSKLEQDNIPDETFPTVLNTLKYGNNRKHVYKSE